MTYRKLCSANGFILFDAILALTLSALLVSLLSYATLNARSVYTRAVLNRELLNVYQSHAVDFEGLLPGSSTVRIYPASSSTPAISIQASARWYGNDRIETDIDIEAHDLIVMAPDLLFVN